MKTGTKIRTLVTLLLLAASPSLRGTPQPVPTKNVGCTRANDLRGNPTQNGCGEGGDGCYDCLYTSGAGGLIECWESPDGLTSYCAPDNPDPDRDPYDV